MKKISFTKMHGLGNCYIYINTFENKLSEKELPKLAKELSNVSTGIGSDGLILICPSEKASVKMRIFNKDGSEAKNCGNGLRCVAKYAYDQKLVKSKEMTIETNAGIVSAQIIKNGRQESLVSVNMGHPKLLRNQIPMKGGTNDHVINEPFLLNNEILNLTAVSMGNPHAVFFVQKKNHELHKLLGPKIEKDPRFPEGINVEFIHVESPSVIHFRVWERGSGITQACGSGACAATVAAILNGHCKKDDIISVRLEGGDLAIKWTDQGDVLMTGPASHICSGEISSSFSD